MASNNENQILKPLIDNANEEGVKPVVQNNGDSILFQRDTDPPATEQMEDVYDDIDDKPSAVEDPKQNREIDIGSENADMHHFSYDEGEQDYSPKFYKNSEKKYASKTYHYEEEDEEEEELKEQKIINGYAPKAGIPKRKLESSNPKNVHVKSKMKPKLRPKLRIAEYKKNSAHSTPENITKSSSAKKLSNSSSAKKHSNSSAKKVKKSNVNNEYKPSNNKIFETLGYFFIIIAILLGVFISKYRENETDFVYYNDYELDAIARLNDCVNPTSYIPISNYPLSFIDYIQNGSSKYLRYDNEIESIVVDMPHQSLFCKTINFGDRHPDLCGIFIVWLIVFLYFIHCSISRARAERIAPDVMKLLKENRMCYLDEAKKKMKESGYWLFGAWWQVVKIISSNDDVKTVKMVDTKPFWSFNDG